MDDDRERKEGRKEGTGGFALSPLLFSSFCAFSRRKYAALSRSSGLCPLADTTHNIVFIPQVYDVGSSREIDDCVTGF